MPAFEEGNWKYENVKFGALFSQINLWKCYDTLAQCYRHTKQYRKALDTVTTSVIVDQRHLMSAAKLWVRVKKDLLKQDQVEEDVITMSLLDCVLRRTVDLTLAEKITLLQREQKVYMTCRSSIKLHKAELHCLDELLRLCNTPVERATVLVEEAKLFWLNPSLDEERCCLSCADEAVNLVSGQRLTTPTMLSTAAEAYLWLYIARTEQLLKQTSATASEISKPGDETDNMDDNSESVDDKPPAKPKILSPFVTVSAENKLSALLDHGLELWKECVSDNRTAEELDLSSVGQSLQLSAVIYHCLRKPLKGLEALRLMQKVTPQGIPGSLWSSLSQLYLTKMLSEIDVPSAVSEVLNEWDRNQDHSFILIKAQHALRQAQVEMSGNLASDLLDKVRSIQPRTRDSCLLEGCTQRLLSQVTQLNRALVEAHLGVGANTIHLAQESVRSHVSVLHHLLGKHFNETLAAKGAGPVDRWVVISEVLQSFLHLGQTYLLVGYSRGATCYLKEGLKVAQSLALPRWCASFLTELGRHSSISGSQSETSLYLQQARDTLFSSQDFTSLPDTELDHPERGEAQTQVANTTPGSQVGGKADTPDSCFGFSSPTANSEGFELRTVPLSMNGLRRLSSTSRSDSSPLLTRPQSCELARHDVECVCLSCADLHAHRLFIDNLLVSCEHYITYNCVDQALDTLSYIQEILEKLSPKISVMLAPYLKGKSKKLPLKSERNDNTLESESVVWIKILHGRIMCNLARAYLLQGETTHSLSVVDEGLATLSGHHVGVADWVLVKSQLNVCKAQIMMASFLQHNSNKHKGHIKGDVPTWFKRVSTPSGTNLKTPSKPEPCFLARNLQELILQDEEYVKHKKGTNCKGRAEKGLKNQVSDGSVFVLDSDEEDSVQPTKALNKKQITGKKCPGKETIDSKNEVISDDICEQMENLSIKQNRTKAGNTGVKWRVQHCGQINTELPGTKTNRRTKKQTSGQDAEDFVQKEPLKPKTTRRKGKTETDESIVNGCSAGDLLPKKTIKRKTKSALPVPTENANMKLKSPGHVFDFDDCEETKQSKGKSKVTQSKKASNTSKTTRSTRQTRVNGIEVQRTVDSSCVTPDRESCLTVYSLSEKPEVESPLVYPHATEPVTLLDQDNSDCEETPFTYRHLNLSKPLNASDLSLDLSIELARADSEGDDQADTLRIRRRHGRLKSLKDQEEAELPRASRITGYKSKGRKPMSSSVSKSGKTEDTKLSHSAQTDRLSLPSSSSILQHLEEALQGVNQFPPLLLYRDICQCMAVHYIKTSPVMAAHYLSEAMAITLRHRNASNIALQHRQCQKAALCGEESSVSYSCSGVSHMFGHNTDMVQTTIDNLPQEWTVCMLSVVHATHGESELYITRLQKSSEPVVKRVCSFTSEELQNVLAQFIEVMEGSRRSMKLTNKTEWWKIRKQLDQDLQDLLERLENSCLKGWKCLLMGELSDPAQRTVLTDTQTSSSLLSDKLSSSVLKALLTCGQCLSDDQLSEVLAELTEHTAGSRTASDMMSVIREKSGHLPANPERLPVLLILDQVLQHLPWESIPLLRGHPVCRIPSIHHLHTQLGEKGKHHVLSSVTEGIDPASTFYILNPDNNLPATQERFHKMFEQQPGWAGITSVPPSKEQFTDALTDHQLLVYCGHGAGSKYLHGDDLQVLKCLATVLLMGCSSGRLQVHGQLEPVGIMHNYYLAGCPCVVANLWDVTDRDIDRLTETLLNTWLVDSTDKCLASVVAKSRMACRLPYLIGCAPVVYGLPVRLR